MKEWVPEGKTKQETKGKDFPFFFFCRVDVSGSSRGSRLGHRSQVRVTSAGAWIWKKKKKNTGILTNAWGSVFNRLTTKFWEMREPTPARRTMVVVRRTEPRHGRGRRTGHWDLYRHLLTITINCKFEYPICWILP